MPVTMSEMEYLQDFEDQPQRRDGSPEDGGEEPEIHIPAADIRMILKYYKENEEMRLMRDHKEASEYVGDEEDREEHERRCEEDDRRSERRRGVVTVHEVKERDGDAAAQEPDVDVADEEDREEHESERRRGVVTVDEVKERDGDAAAQEPDIDVADEEDREEHESERRRGVVTVDEVKERDGDAAAQETDVEMTIEEPDMIPPTPPRIVYGFRRDMSVSSGSLYQPSSEGETEEGEHEEEMEVVEEGEREEQMEVVEEGRGTRKRRVTSRRRKSVKQLSRRQRQCTMPGCTSRVINLSRHYQQMHPGTPAPKALKRTYAGNFACPNCDVCTVRLDLHLMRIHQLEKGSLGYVESMVAAKKVTSVVQKKQTDDLDRALVEYRVQLQDRSVGDRRTEATARSHVAAVKKLLPALTKDEIERLQEMGKKDGLVDSLLEKGTLSAASLRTYLHSLVGFLEFLSASTQWMRHLGMLSSVVQSVKSKVQMISNSLKQDVARQAVEAAAQCPAGQLNLKPWMVGAYLASNEITLTRNLIHRHMNGEQMTMQEFCRARNCLAVQLLLVNAKRAGDISHLDKEAILKATLSTDKGSDEDEQAAAELYVIQHKEAVSGKRCPLRIDGELLEDLQLYCRHVATSTSKRAFTTFKGGAISASNMSKMVDSTWKTFGKNQGISLPRLTASEGRKLAVTTHREEGPSREEQAALAAHMAHNVTTADRYYDKALRREERGKALKRIQASYKKASKDHASKV